MFGDVRVRYRLMVVVVKTMQTANMHNILLEISQGCFNVLERLGIMMDTQAIDVVTFDFKGTRVL